MMLESTYKPKLARIIKIINETPDVKTFRIELVNPSDKENFRFTPGQFAEVSVFGFGEAPFAIASDPEIKDFFEISVRAVGRVTKALHSLKENSIIGVRAPLGRGYPINEFFDMNVIVVAGGTGLFGVSSLLHFICKHRCEFRDVVLLYGARTPKDIPRKYDLEYWSKYISVNLTVDRADSTWKGHVGLVTDLFRKVSTPVGPKTIAAVCGPPIMIRATIPKLLNLGISRNRIFISLEWKMHCGIGKCGHCMLSTGKLVCVDGPIFRLSEINEGDIR